MTPNNLIQQHFDDAYQIGLVEVERLARKILAKHPNLDEFVMAMGSAFFTTKDDGNIHPFERAYMKPLDRFLTAWDDTLCLTGEPMRFTATGRKETAWGCAKSL